MIVRDIMIDIEKLSDLHLTLLYVSAIAITWLFANDGDDGGTPA